ncbi:unnamed protein product [Somion occarium]|uniref:Phytase-like domain-containing protein n=1 Tax=Somion occarium TaxID=3059160 RepID=A0ABP1DSR5_9APHY
MLGITVGAFVATFAGVAFARPLIVSSTNASSSAEPDPSFATSVKLNGVTFVNKGLVGFGLIPSDFKESTGDTLGGIGSAIALKKGTFQQNADGTFSGTFITQPDRGFNVDGTVNYQARQHVIDFVLSPYYGDVDLSFADAQKTLQLTYKSTLLYTERNDVQTSGLDPLAVRAAQSGFPNILAADPEMPIPSKSFSHLSIDAEGLALNDDGTFWTSDEYGPYIYLFDSEGHLLQTIQPPEAVLPEVKGKINFTADSDPDTGRAGNQGLEGLTLDDAGTTLYALLQTATIQDGGDDKSTSRFTRLLAFDVSNPSVRPSLVGEWVVPLPQNKKDLIDISDATNIAGSKFDSPKNPIAKKGKLDKSITAATYVGFVDFIDDTQLARFGLHNDDPADQTLIDAKWESLALAPVGDPANPDDFFLFTAADNDFISTHGVSLGQPFNAGLDNDNQFLVFRVTLPTK